MARYFARGFIGAFLALLVVCTSSAASPRGSFDGAASERHPAFRVPPGLQPRVDFWVKIFGEYSKFESVIHHRDYPQVVFTVLDFRREAAWMSEARLEKFRRQKFDALIKEYHAALRELIDGEARTPLARDIEQRMAFVPGGPEKYRRIIELDLIRSQRGIREKMGEAISRSGRYLPYMERIFVDEFGLPIELTRLPFVESSFDYTAYSSVGAAGIWQFMPRTAKLYMRVGKDIDERRDPLIATRGAARYLRDAYGRIGVWPLAVTSYNHGVAGVLSKMRKLGTTDFVSIAERHTDRLFGFASLNFFPSLLAALEVYDRRHEFFPDIEKEPPLQFVSTRLSSRMSVRYVSQQLGLPVTDLQRLNYAITRATWEGRYSLPAGYTLHVPVAFRSKLAVLGRPEISPQVTEVAQASSVYGGAVYKVRPGDTLGKIATRFGLTVAELRSLNNRRGDTVRVGEVLVVSRREGASTSVTQRGGNTRAEAQPKVLRRTVTVRRGDSLWEIARREGTTVEKLKRLSPGASKGLRPGMKIVVE